MDHISFSKLCGQSILNHPDPLDPPLYSQRCEGKLVDVILRVTGVYVDPVYFTQDVRSYTDIYLE